MVCKIAIFRKISKHEIIFLKDKTCKNETEHSKTIIIKGLLNSSILTF